MEPERLIAQILVQHAHTAGGLMPALQEIQEDLGYIPEDAYPAIADALNLSVAEVHGVVSFYHDFRTEPAGRHRIQVCQAESCQAAGSRALTEHVQQRLGIAMGETSPDGAVTLEPVYCLGNCACSPSLSIDSQSYARMDAQQFDDLVAELLGEGEG